MLDIMDALHSFVPTKRTNTVLRMGDKEFPIVNEQMHQLLMGGDQLTAAHARCGLLIRGNSTTESNSLLGLCPVAEDWHAKVVMLQVSHIAPTYTRNSHVYV